MQTQPKGRYALVNGRVALPDEVVLGKAVVVENAHIVGIADDADLGSETARIDVGGRLITPGLIDIHTHGALLRDFNEGTDEAFATVTGENGRRGITSICGTTAAATIPSLCKVLDNARSWMKSPHKGAQLLGIHMESPYLSMAQKGAQDPGNVRMPSDGTPDELLQYADVIRIFMLAPELPGAMALIDKLVKHRIVVAVGHSSARDEQVVEAMQHGLSHVTHLWSAMSSTVREGPWRKPGVLESALLFDGLTVEMISDNKHLPPNLMKLAYKCVGPERLVAVSDATSGAGMPEGSIFKMGALDYIVEDGVGMVMDHTSFAGSTTLVNEMLPILTEKVGIPLPQAVRLLTLNPARIVSVADRKGSLASGKDADIAVFNPDWTAWQVIIAGQLQ
jgi:N-acetylglucosamine-6-phosphate deacetylase